MSLADRLTGDDETEYDVDVAGARETDLELGGESRRFMRLKALVRLVTVVRAFLPLAVASLRDRKRYLLFGGGREVTSEDRYRRAEYLLATLLDLGPTFIKLGQMLSTRPDALPREYVDVLSRLQDEVPPAPWPSARAVVEAELGPVDDVYDEFDTEAISGASLGQVYVAELDGERVAVKVLRPGVRARVEADLRALDVLVPAMMRFAREGHRFTFENLTDEFAATIREEMDYGHEALRLEQVRRNFADHDRVKIPAAVDSHTTDRVLTMEYVDGTKIDDVEAIDAMGVDRDALTTRLERAYIQMIIEDGVFHADPHPGNLAVQADGTLVFYDFGMTGVVDERLQEQILTFYVAIANDDIDGVIDSFIAMDALDPTADRDLMRRMFSLALDQFRGREVERHEVRQLVSEFQSNLYEFPLRLPRNLALIVRVSTVLEGVLQTLDPDFDMLSTITDYVEERGRTSEGREAFVEPVRDAAVETVRAVARNPQGVERTLDRIERGRLTVDLPVGAADPFDDLARQLVYGLLFFGGTVSTMILYGGGATTAAGVGAVGTATVGLLLLRARRRSSGIRAVPQFTRHQLRRRREE